MRFLGHPVHPLLVHFPIAFWSAATVCDGLSLLGMDGAWPYAGLFLAIGLVTALAAMLPGAFDFAALDEKSAPIAIRHMLLMATSWAVYLAALLTRSDAWALVAEPRPVAILLSFAGFLCMSVGAYFGGQLVYKFAAGVEIGVSDSTFRKKG